jgi:hypothetical protein
MSEATWLLPRILRAEVKLTTSMGVALDKRERESLVPRNTSTLGIVAVLFRCADRQVDGRWLIADPNDYWGEITEAGLHISKEDLLRAECGQPSLREIREYVRTNWKAFLQAFREPALAGLEPLKKELSRLHIDGALRSRLPTYQVLDLDHRKTVSAIISAHGESVAGQIFQALFSYLLASAGYRSVTINTVGVPDVELGEPNGERVGYILGPFSQDEVSRLHSYCEAASDQRMAKQIAAVLEGKSPSENLG